MDSTLPPKRLDAIDGDRRLELLLDAVKDYAIYLLDIEGHVASWNTGAQRFKGYTADEIIGAHFSRFYTPEDRARGLPAEALRIAAEQGKFESEGWRIRKDGTCFWTSVVIDPVIDADGHLIGYAKITRDLTERRLAQQEIDRAREALAQAQKMEAIGRLTGGVAHDFNNLLTVIRSSADLLRRPDLSEERRQKYLDAIATTADRAAHLTAQLLAFARRQPLQPEVFDVEARLKGMKQIATMTVGAAILLGFADSDDAGLVEADPNQFETALLNLVINARDAMPGGGALRVSARAVNGVPAVRNHAAAEGAFVAIAVEDSGTGIDPMLIERIFEPFFTTKGPSKGTGLGLSQVYGFAKQSGGEVSVESEVGRGTTFTLYLPRAQGDRRIASAAVAVDRPALQVRRVLLVEDNETVGQFALSLLEDLGQVATWATHADAALQILEARRGDFDMVFSDVVMSGMNGIDLGHEVRRRWPDLPIVLTSGYSHVLAEEGNHGFTFLKKPYTVDALLGALLGTPKCL